MLDNQIPQVPPVTIHEHRFAPIVKKAALVAIVIVVGLAGVGLGYFYSQSQIPKHTLTVKGVGSVSIPANEATISIKLLEGLLCVPLGANNPVTYAQDYNAKTATFQKHLASLGITDKDVEIEYSGVDDSTTSATSPSCKAVSKITVHLTNPEDVSKDDQILGFVKPDFDYVIPNDEFAYRVKETKNIKIKDIIPYRNQARDLAIKDAANQVAKIIALNHKKVGNIISVKDIPGETQEPTVSANGTIPIESQDAYYGTPIESSGTQVKAAYEVTYEQY